MGLEILIEKNIICPVCGLSVPMKYPQPRFYSVGGRETDLHVISYRWKEGLRTDLLPHYYTVWQCSQCLFANFVENIENPKGAKENYVREAYKNISAEKMMILSSLRELVPKGEVDFGGAVALHLAAYISTEFPEEEKIDHNKLGRLALRLGWLFRERSGSSGSSSSAEKTKSEALQLLERCSEQLNSEVQNIDKLLNEVKEAADVRVAELDSDKGTNGAAENPYSGTIGSLETKIEEMQTLVTLFQRAVTSDAAGTLKSLEELGSAADTNLDQHLMALLKDWPELPHNENLAIRRSIKAFEYSLSHEAAQQSLEKTMTVINLVIDLWCRVGEPQQALQYIGKVSKAGETNKRVLVDRIDKGREGRTLSPHDQHMLRAKIKNIDDAMLQARDMRRTILDQYMKENKETITDVLKKTATQSAVVQAMALKKAGIIEPAIDDMKMRNVITEGKKKGLFH